MKRTLALCVLGLVQAVVIRPVFGQSLGNAGTIEGTVLDAAVPKATITIRNGVSGYSQSTVTASDGSFRLVNIPANPYQLEVMASGFASFTEDVSVRAGLPVQIKANLAVAGSQTSVNVEAAGDIVENDPSAHLSTFSGTHFLQPRTVVAKVGFVF